jgi:hypothetical protein
MVNSENTWIFCGVLAFVLLFNAGILLTFLRGRGNTLIRGIRELRNPWQAEDNALLELRRRVASLRTSRFNEGEEDD